MPRPSLGGDAAAKYASALHCRHMNQRNSSALLAIALAITSATLQAEQLYVADKLVLNVYAEAEQGSSRVATIETGDAVEEIERAENFVHVRLADGREGWVGANYLSAEPPAIVRLKALQAERSGSSAPGTEAPKQLTDEVARLKKQNAALTAELTGLKKKAASAPAMPAAAPAVNESSTPAAHAASEPEEPVAATPVVVVQHSYWWAWLLAVIAAGGIGFVGGYQTLGRRVRERFGGVKVY
jgi:SH3 domain protein